MPPAAPARFGALQHRNFRLFIIGQAISLSGTWIQNVAQGWLVLQLSNSAFLVGLVSTLGSLPVLLFTLYGGVVADRVNRHRFITILQALMLLDALALAFLTQFGVITVAWVGALAVVLGVLMAFEVPARQAFVIELVGRDDLMNAIALNSSIFNVSRMVGPAIAGVLIGAAGIAVCFFVNSASYVAVVIGLLLIRLPKADERRAARAPRAFWEGFSHVLSDPWSRALVVLTATFSIFGFAFMPMLPVFAREVLKVQAAGYGGLVSAVGVGATAAALFLAAFGHRVPRRRTVLGGGLLLGAGLVASAFTRSYLVAMAIFTVVGAAMVLNNVLTNTLLQTYAPDHLRGRIMGVYSFLILGMMPFGSLQAGFVAEHLGVQVAIGAGGGICLLVLAWVTWRLALTRRRTARSIAEAAVAVPTPGPPAPAPPDTGPGPTSLD
ncbi:MAG: MFS transporter [Gemmatimonadales bacterium]